MFHPLSQSSRQRKQIRLSHYLTECGLLRACSLNQRKKYLCNAEEVSECLPMLCGQRNSSFHRLAAFKITHFPSFVYRASRHGSLDGNEQAVSRVQGDFSCTGEVLWAIPFLKKAYGDSMDKVLHVGPESCSIVSRLLKEESEAWGVEPYDIGDVDSNCQSLLRKGIVCVADIKFPLPYRAKSFSVVIVSDALDYLSPKYINKTLPDLARVSANGLIIFAGQQRAKVVKLSKFGGRQN